VWFSGVDTKYWCPREERESNLVLVYQKGPDSDLPSRKVIQILKEKGLAFELLTYGKYKQSTYLQLLQNAKFVIWIGHTETQGLAQFQAWSMNVPTLVSELDGKRLSEKDGVHASPSPFLNDSCGRQSALREISSGEIQNFIDDLNKFTPRKWILDNAEFWMRTEELMAISYE
jgi:hypothetical protein